MKTTGKASALSSGKAINGRWTREEHELFLQALNEYGREWKKVAKRIKTRSSAQIRSHAQKYFQKLQKEQKAGLHGGAAALHGSHVVLDKAPNGKKKSTSRGDKTITKKKRKLKGKGASGTYKRQKRPVSPNQVSKSYHTSYGRFSPVQKARASPNISDTSKSPSFSSIGPNGTFPSPYTSPFVTRNFVKTIATKKKLVQSWEQRLRTLLSKRKKVSGFSKGGIAASLSNTKGSTPRQGKSPQDLERHDDLSVTPRLSPLNIPQNEGEISRIRDRLNRRDELVKVDLKIIDVIDSACNAPCICGEPKLIFHCSHEKEKKMDSGDRYTCITVRQKMLNIYQRSYEKNGSFSTPQSISLLEQWKKINLEVARAKSAELSYQNAELLYMALSPVARENLSILDNEELSAVQVLIGSMMGIRPRKSKNNTKGKKVSITKTTTTTTTKTTINYEDKDQDDDAGSDKSESDSEDESESESEPEADSDSSDDDSSSDEEEE